jgi:uncharacterized protein
MLDLIQRMAAGRLQVDRLTCTIADLPPALDGMTVVQMSDFHYDGLLLSEDLLREAIVATNQANPDLIFLTGDFISHAPGPIAQLAPQLQALRSRYGTFAVLGNHDLLNPRSRTQITEALTEAEITVLWNQVVYPCGPEVAIVGMPDFWAKAFDPEPLFESIPPTIPRLVLSHNPDSAAVLQKWRVDLQFSGHTHGGQIVIPGIGNMSALVAQQYDHLPQMLKTALPILRTATRVVEHWEWASGWHQVGPLQPHGQNQLYVNRGLGTYPPGRLFCPPEVTVITLVRSQINAISAEYS